MARPRTKAAAPPDLRAELAALMRATLEDEAKNGTWRYEEIRPLSMPPARGKWKAGVPVVGDCSKGVQYLCWWTNGVPDPMQGDYGPWGNSQTLWLHLQHVASASDLDVGDIVTFGPDGDAHAAMVLEPGPDPLVWSFGHQGAPNTYRLSQDPRPQQFLRNPLPKYVPTDIAKARARTGWFAWVAWRLGEGDYREFGKANPQARPNVPKRIPLSWWRRYAKFLLRRKKATPPSAPAA